MAAKKIFRSLREGHPQGEEIDGALLEHVSPIEWDNVMLYSKVVRA